MTTKECKICAQNMLDYCVKKRRSDAEICNDCELKRRRDRSREGMRSLRNAANAKLGCADKILIKDTLKLLQRLKQTGAPVDQLVQQQKERLGITKTKGEK